MEQKELLSACHDELVLVLSFFPRVDAKASVVLAVDTGMVGYLAAHLPGLIPSTGGSAWLRRAQLCFSRAVSGISTGGRFPN